MGKRVIYVAKELWQEMSTTGFEDHIRCLTGLPEGARFRRAWWEHAKGTLALMFEHESWSDWPLSRCLDEPFVIVYERVNCDQEQADG